MRIAVLDDYQGVAIKYMRRSADWTRLHSDIDAEIVPFTEPLGGSEAVVRALDGFDVVVAMRERTAFGADVLARLSSVRLLVTTGMHNAAIDVAAAHAAGITVCGTNGVGHATVEHTWALILAAARHLPSEDRAVRDGGWQHTVGSALHGRTLGVMGLGRLGTAVAHIGQAFGMTTIAWSQHLTAEHAAQQSVTAVTKQELLRRSDVLSLHLVLSERTRGLVGAADLAEMKPGAILVNTSRGPIIDEDALVAAVRAGQLGCAALDVFDTEPLPAGHPLRTAPNTVLSPHLGYVTDDTYTVFYGEAVSDIVAFHDAAPVRMLQP